MCPQPDHLQRVLHVLVGLCNALQDNNYNAG
jgi:hypothetical protein